MKHLYLLFISIFFISTSFSQIKKGNWDVSTQIANINYNVTLKDFNFTINPAGLYFISNRVAFGGQIALAFSTATKIWALGAAPTSKQFLTLNDMGGFFLQESIGISFVDNNGSTSSALVFGASPGYSFILNDHITIDLGIGWSAMHNFKANALINNNFGLNVGFSIYLGGEE